jgi:hypothetical protein
MRARGVRSRAYKHIAAISPRLLSASQRGPDLFQRSACNAPPYYSTQADTLRSEPAAGGVTAENCSWTSAFS